MQDNLEDIAFSEVVNRSGLCYTQLRRELHPVYKKAWRDIAKGYCWLFALLALCVWLLRGSLVSPFLLVPIAAFAVGYCLAFLHLFIHAAAHYDLHPLRQKNDVLCDYLLGVLFGIRIKPYRKIHWQHHLRLGKTDDSEHSYFNELNLSFLLKCITGLHVLSVLRSRARARSKEDPVQSPAFRAYVLLVHISVLLVLWIAGGWALEIIWIAALAIVFPLFATLRQLMEHRDTRASGKVNYGEHEHGKVSRLFGTGLIDSSMGGAGFNRHMLHHWDPLVPYTRLAEVEQFLLECPSTEKLVRISKTSYRRVFFQLFKLR